MARIAFKVTLWETYEVNNPNDLEQIKEDLQRRIIREGEDAANDYDLTMDYEVDTSEVINPVDNNGEATVILYDDDEQVLWSNIE